MKSARAIRELIDVSIIPEGSIVAVRMDGIKAKRVREIAGDLAKAGKTRGLSFIVMTPEIELEVLTNEQLAQAGLRRVKSC